MSSETVSDTRLAQLIRLHPAGSPINTTRNRDVSFALRELQNLRSKPVASGAAMIEQMSDEEFNRDRSNENPNVGKVASGVEVKPLDWRQHGDIGRAETPIGVYEIRRPSSRYQAYFNGLSLDPALKPKTYDGPIEALEAVNQDYRNRILSALLPKATAPVVSEPVAWQPIETAPKDGTHILLHWPNIPKGIKELRSTSKATGTSVGWFEASEAGVGFMTEGDHAVPVNQEDCTHWLPIPAPPEAAMKEA